MQEQIILPYADPSKAGYPIALEFTKYLFGTGNSKCATTDVHDIGKFVARIVSDERTLNRYVFCYTNEVTQQEVLTLAEKISGKKISLEPLSAEEVQQRIDGAKEIMMTYVTEYNYCLWIRGDNTVENARKAEYGGALDARGLYPELTKELKALPRNQY